MICVTTLFSFFAMVFGWCSGTPLKFIEQCDGGVVLPFSDLITLQSLLVPVLGSILVINFCHFSDLFWLMSLFISSVLVFT